MPPLCWGLRGPTFQGCANLRQVVPTMAQEPGLRLGRLARPRVLERDRSIEHHPARLRLGVHAEIAEPLELHLVALLRPGETRFEPTPGENLERAWIEVRLEIDVLVLERVFHVEEAIVDAIF